MHQLRMAHGKQFHPAVVDAFWAIARKRPGEIMPPEATSAAVVVV
jgi:hypothetical protein